MDAIADNSYIFEQIRSNIYGTLQKSFLRLSESDSRELLGYGYRFAISRPMAAAHRESGGIGLSAKGESIHEKKFIYRNGEAA